MTTAARTHLHAHESTAFTKVSLGPLWGELNGAFSIGQGQWVLLQAAIAIRTIPKEPKRELKTYENCVSEMHILL